MKFGKFDYAAFLLFCTYAICSLIIPVVLVEVARDLAFDLDKGGMSAGGVLQFGRSITMVGSMLICSMLASRYGLRRSLAAAAICMSCGIVFAAMSQWYWMLLAVLVVAGIGEGLIEGLATPFVGELHKGNETGKYMNISHGFWSVGIFVFIPLLGWLLGCNISWRILCVIVAVFTLVPAVILLYPDKNKFEQLEGKGRFDAAGAWKKVRDIAGCRQFWIFFMAMFVAGGGEYGATFWCASLLRLEYGAAPVFGGLATAVFSAGMMLGRTASGIFVRQKDLAILIIAAAAGGAVVTTFFYSVASVTGVMILLFFAGLFSAPFWPSVQCYSVDRLGHFDSTTLYIMLSCAGVPGCGVLSVVMGKMGDLWGLRTAFMAIPVCYVILAGLIFWDFYICKGKNKLSSLKDPQA